MAKRRVDKTLLISLDWSIIGWNVVIIIIIINQYYPQIPMRAAVWCRFACFFLSCFFLCLAGWILGRVEEHWVRKRYK